MREEKEREMKKKKRYSRNPSCDRFSLSNTEDREEPVRSAVAVGCCDDVKSFSPLPSSYSVDACLDYGRYILGVRRMSAAVAGVSTEDRRKSDAEPAGQRMVKQDRDNDIKDYAETTMNELLGWYGYDKLDTRAINLKSIGPHFPATSSSSSSPIRPENDASEEDTAHSTSPSAENESTLSNPGQASSIICAWCLKMGLKLFTLKTSSGETKEFCSEPCFNQCRRAAFKKNRVCNWCRHVRHTVNYVDFQDGDDQLQFCSDKCLNQYKMQIFCKETQAYLQMNPHLQGETSKNTANSKLITPDLWLRDCQESTNGGASHSGDEMQSRQNDNEELEDLSVAPKSEHGIPSNHGFPQNREQPKNLSASLKDNIAEKCNALASYLSEERDKNDRRKRHHQEMNREVTRKRQRVLPFRNKTSLSAEAPPAHLSSATPSMTFQNHSSIFPPSSFPLPLRSKSPVHVNPPAAHSKTFSPHPGLTNPALHPGLPPPPPLLNNDMYHTPYNPPIFPSHHQQLDAVLRMQGSYPPTAPFGSSFFHDTMLPFLRSSATQPSTVPQPNTVMLPYPIFVPLPIPIPIPLPLKCFLPKDKQDEITSKETASENKVLLSKDTEKTDNDSTSSSKCVPEDESSSNTSKDRKQTVMQSSVDSDFEEHKSFKKTRKR